MLALFLSAFVTFFVVIDPPGCAPIFASLTREGSPGWRRQMAFRSVVIAAIVLILFALAGSPLLDALGISLDAFRVAGGIMLFLIALEMVFEKRTERREERAEEIHRRQVEQHRAEPEDISVFPMAIPMIAGPGSIATAMLTTSHSHGTGLLVALAALICVLVIMLAMLLASGAIMRVLGDKLEAMITRILGVLLAALAAQYVIDGIKASFGV
ncbi:MarC family protein [Sphingomonas nostoxanthinifaciens]|uniref:MarC family protein n=1 Tax=Sphingomonas nostoxanthinifaciens TaxID=2872652 RepID=UPI001CC1D8F8|nr:MarC family protein [Sphingomonas nostoxanthinifaciens]UAK24495.1 MarC family protein [Sphingomonas nostoxanthinifaciens]